MTRRFRIVNSRQPARQFDAENGRASDNARQVVTNEIPDLTLHPLLTGSSQLFVSP